MPTVLRIRGWRIFFYSNERGEPMHVHCRKAEREGKFWIDPEEFRLTEAFSVNLGPQDRRDLRRILLAHLDLISREWHEMKRRQQP